MTLKEFIILSEVANKTLMNESIAKLPKPERLGGKETPADLNDLTMGRLMMLHGIANEYELLTKTTQIVMGIDPYNLDAGKVIGFVMWVSDEVKRIGKMFASIKMKHTSDEIEAGIDKLDFGLFGLVDWYARRMRITNHDEVERVPWVRVFTCMRMDNEIANYEKRLRNIYQKKYETKER